MIQAFDFEHNGRKFTCTVEARRAAPEDDWWWFGVSDDRHRYAVFHAARGDTRDSVRKRIIAYYDDLLDRRSRPPEPREHWVRRGRPPNQPAAPVTTDIEIEVVEQPE